MIKLDFSELTLLLEGRGFGVHDVACPLCGPGKRSEANRRRKVLRVWHCSPGFMSFSCARCGGHGHASEHGWARTGSAEFDATRASIAARGEMHAERRLRIARWLYASAVSTQGTAAENYLRRPRGLSCSIPSSIRFLPTRGQHPAAMIAPFGWADEIEAGVLEFDIHNLKGVHITKIAPDGLRKAETEADKIMIGPSMGWPIMLAPVNDNLGLVIAEGIEDGLSMHQATGLGAWAAGSAGRLPALAERVPSYVDIVHVMVDDDDAGRTNAAELRRRLSARGISVRLVTLSDGRAA